MTNPAIKELATTLLQMIGHAIDETIQKDILMSIGSWPVPQFQPDEFSSSFVDHDHGFEISFQAAMLLTHPRVSPDAKGRTPIIAGGFFYAGGKDEFSPFTGALPSGITWSDTVETMPKKLGEPKTTVRNKKTGGVRAYRWQIEPGITLESAFGSDGSLKHLYLGLDAS